MKRFLFISQQGESLPLALRVLKEGNEPIFLNLDNPELGKDLLRTVTSTADIKPDYVIYDSGERSLLGKYREANIPVYGDSLVGDAIKYSPAYLAKLLKASDIHQKDDYQFSVTMLIGDKKVLDSFIIFKDYGLLDKGRSYPIFMGSCGVRLSDCELLGKLSKFTNLLTSSNFHGFITLDLAITNDKLSCRRVAPYFDFESLFGLLECVKQPVSSLLASLAVGNLVNLKATENWFIQVSLPLLPYPLTDLANTLEGTPVKGINAQNEKHLWFQDVYKNGTMKCYGSSGLVAHATSRGEWIRETKRRVAKTLHNLAENNFINRSDIGDSAFKTYERLMQRKYVQEKELLQRYS